MNLHRMDGISKMGFRHPGMPVKFFEFQPQCFTVSIGTVRIKLLCPCLGSVWTSVGAWARSPNPQQHPGRP